MNRSKTERAGFTIIEVMVVVVIMGIITTVVATMFAKGSFALRHGDSHNTLQRANRLLTARVSPYIASAFDPIRDDGFTPILNPTQTTSDVFTAATIYNGPAATAPNAVRFITTEDFLADNYPAQFNSAIGALTLGDLNPFVYQIVMRNEPRNGENFSNVYLQKVDPFSSYDVVTTGGDPVERPLFFSREAANLDASGSVPPLRFYHPSVDVLVMEAEISTNIRGEGPARMAPKQVFRTTFNLPQKGI